MADVSVVIPTIGRPSLSAAIRSAREQDDIHAEIIVVYDTAEVSDRRVSTQVAADTTLYTGGGRGGSYARNLGVKHATSELVAFLDDDDEWTSTKLAVQVRIAKQWIEKGSRPVVLGQVRQRLSGADHAGKAIPTRLLRPNQTPEDYLFRHRFVGPNRPMLATSTILTSTTLALECPWDECLGRHQDWDWVIRLARHPRVRVEHVRNCSTIYAVGSSNSISAKPDWHQSLRWAESWVGIWNRQTTVDFLFSQTLRYAVQSRDLQGVSEVLRAAGKSRRFPSLFCVASALSGLVPRHYLEKVALSGARR